MLKLNLENTVNTVVDNIRREPKRLDWLKLNSSELLNLHKQSYVEYLDTQFIAAHKLATMSFEHLVNSVLLPTVPIYVIEGEWLNEVYLFKRGERFGDTLHLYKRSEGLNQVHLYKRSEYLDDVIDYYIILNTIDSALEGQLDSWAKRWQPIGRTYSITII